MPDRTPHAAGVTVIILHPEAPTGAGPLVDAVVEARAILAERHQKAFHAAGATDVQVLAGPPDDISFGARLRGIASDVPTGAGLIVLGSGAVPLANRRDLADFVAVAAGPPGHALANNRFSADIVAVADALATLANLPDLATDNALPRWLSETGCVVSDLARRWRLAVDIDTPLDLVLLGARMARSLSAADRGRVEQRIAAIRATVVYPRAELVVTGRTNPTTLAWLARATASRTRALVEERGLRTSATGQRPPASILGVALDADGPASLGAHLARLGEAAVVDSRVLLAHRLGADERAWPLAADRFASDLLLHERVADPWLRDLTRAAADAPIPVLLGGHTLVGPGLRLILGRRP